MPINRWQKCWSLGGDPCLHNRLSIWIIPTPPSINIVAFEPPETCGVYKYAVKILSVERALEVLPKCEGIPALLCAHKHRSCRQMPTLSALQRWVWISNIELTFQGGMRERLPAQWCQNSRWRWLRLVRGEKSSLLASCYMSSEFYRMELGTEEQI